MSTCIYRLLVQKTHNRKGSIVFPARLRKQPMGASNWHHVVTFSNLSDNSLGVAILYGSINATSDFEILFTSKTKRPFFLFYFSISPLCSRPQFFASKPTREISED